MNSDSLKQWLGFTKFMLGSFVLGVVTLLVNHEIQQRELEMKEQEAMGQFLEQAITDNTARRLRFAQYFAAVTRSETLRERWVEYLKQVQNDYAEAQRQLAETTKDLQQTLGRARDVPDDSAVAAVGLEIDQKVTQIEQIKADLNPNGKLIAADITPRVYLHIRDESQRNEALAFGKALATATAAIVPGVQRVKSGPSQSELRYFNSTDQEQVTGIFNWLKAREPAITLKYVAGYENSGLIRPHHYELWFSKGALTGK